MMIEGLREILQIMCPYCSAKANILFKFENVNEKPIKSIDCVECKKNFHAKVSLEIYVKCYEANFIEYE